MACSEDILLQDAMEPYYEDPVAFAEDILGFTPDRWQRDVLQDICRYPKVSVKSGQGVGKTALEACALLWFLMFRPYSRVVATAPTMQQLFDVLWSEIDKWRSESLVKDVLKWTKTKVSIDGEESRWFATAKTATRPENMQGFHEDHMLFIVDEASGIDDRIMEAVLGTLTGWDNHLLLCGNPTKTTGVFYDSHNRDMALYRRYTVSSMDSTRTNKENIDSLIRKYGWDSNVVRVRVRGEFPKQEDDVFISLELVEQCGSRLHDLAPGEGTPFLILGVDVARFGDDETVIYENAMGRCRVAKSRRGQDLMATVGDIVWEYWELLKRYPDYTGMIFVNIDDTGLGGGVTDRLKEVKREQRLSRLVVIPINAAEKIETDSTAGRDAAKRYNNLTTDMWATLRDLLKEKQIVIEDDDDTFAQLVTRKYRMASNGKLEIEPKKEMKKRGIASPDRGDALALSVYLGKVKKHTGTAPTEKVLAGLSQENYWGR